MDSDQKILEEISNTEANSLPPQNTENAKTMAVVRAFIANVSIAIVKFICFYISKSSAMLSESVHSGVDGFNSICLLVGIKRGSRPADTNHQFGYGLETNIWTMFACLIMFGATLVATLHGIRVLLNGKLDDIQAIINYFPWVAGSLVISIMFEMWAVRSASNAVLVEAGETSSSNAVVAFFKSIKHIKNIKTPTTKFVWFEDTIAFTGALIALIALCIVVNVPEEFAHYPDAIASIIIGMMLLSLAVILLINNVNFLTGQAAQPQTEEIIKEVASNIHGISEVHELKTMDMGTSGLIVNMNIEVDPQIQVKDADDIADLLERKIRKHVDNVSHVNIEIQAHDAEDNWEEKFEKLVKEGEQIQAIDTHEAKMLSNFFGFVNTVVKEVMVPRTKINFFDLEDDVQDLVKLIIETGHTRIPVYKDSIDNILGVINAKDVLRYINNNEKGSVEKLVRDILIVPENKFISDLLSDLIATKNQMAAIVDEHGGIAGIVTIEDILEEIVGEIYDEFDKEDESTDFVQINPNTIEVSADTEIEDLNEDYDLNIPSEDFQTIGGYVFGLIGREPEINDTIEDKNITYTVLEMDNRRISRIKMEKTTPFIKKSEIEKQAEEIQTVTVQEEQN